MPFLARRRVPWPSEAPPAMAASGSGAPAGSPPRRPVALCAEPNGYYVRVMSDELIAVYECPGCKRPVESGEVYVVALEYEVEPGFSLHQMTADSAAVAHRRFHVRHFRRRIGDRHFALVRAEPAPVE